MYTPKYIAGVNFMCFPRLRFDFKKGEVTMIYGETLDDEGSLSNGSGKSSLIKAVTVLLVDIPDKTLTKDNYVLDGEKRAMLVGEFYNPVNEELIKIKRKIYRKDSNTVSVYVNGIQNKEITGVAEANKWILERLDITRDDLLDYYILNQDHGISFFGNSDTEKKKVMGRFSNTAAVDAAAERMKEKVSETEKKREKVLSSIDVINGRIEVLEESLEYEKEGRKEDEDDDSTELKESIDNEKAKVKKLTKSVEETNEKIAEQEGKLGDLEDNTDKISDTQTKIKAKREKYKTADEKLGEVKSLKNSLQVIADGEIECPECGHKWSTADAEISLEEAQKAIKSAEKLIEKTETRLSVIKKNGEKLKKLKEELEEEQEELDEVNEKIEDLQSDLKSDKRSLESSEKHLATLEKQLTELTEFKIDDKRVRELEKELEEEETTLAEKKRESKKLGDEQEMYNFWKINYLAFKTDLVNGVLESFEGYVNYYLTLFRTNLTIKIEGFRVTKQGTISEKINILASKDGGRLFKPFARLSGGQRGRINVCGILTIQSLINSKSKSGGLDMLLLDEVFDGLDPRGQAEITNLIEESEITTMLISHGNYESSVGNSLFVRMENEESKIVDKNLLILS